MITGIFSSEDMTLTLLFYFGDLYEHVDHLFQGLYRDIFLAAVEIVSACREVRAREALV